MDYTTARIKIAQQQLREWKKNRGTAVNCTLHNERPIKVGTIYDRTIQENRINKIEDLTEVKRIIRNYFR